MDDIGDSPGEFPAAFSGALGRLQVAVLAACGEHEFWPAKVAASVTAAIQFAGNEPESAQLLTVQVLVRRPDGGQRYVRMVEHFAELLRAEVPPDRRRPGTTEQALVGGIATTIADRLRFADSETLLAAAPELVEFVLLPYLSPAEAKKWASWAKRMPQS